MTYENPSNRRRFPRITISIPIHLNTTDQHYISAETLTLGLEGISFVASEELSTENPVISIDMPLFNSAIPLHIGCKMVRSFSQQCVYSAKFTGLHGDRRSELERFIEENIAKSGETDRRSKDRRNRGRESPNTSTKESQIRTELKRVLYKRVVITGIGVVSPIGIGKESFWKSLEMGENGVTELEMSSSHPLPAKVAGQIKNFKPHDFISARRLREMDRFTQFAVAAARLAMEDAKLIICYSSQYDVGICLGTTSAGMPSAETQYAHFLRNERNKISPFAISSIIASNGPSQVAIELGIRGSSMSVSTACASSTDAIGQAFRMLQHGNSRIMLAGGSEALITPFVLELFSAGGLLSKQNSRNACRPFDRERDGTVLGEGSAILVLEELEHALNRGAHIYGEVIGYGSTNDAFHSIRQLPSGVAASKAILRAFEGSGVDVKDVQLVNLHGSSTGPNDALETKTMKEIFGPHAYHLMIHSTKSLTGHLQGACGSVETVATLLALERGIVHPTLHLDNPDPACDLNYIPKLAVRASVKCALKVSSGFGGNNAALILREYVQD